MGIGFGHLVIGAVLPFMMVINVIQSTLALNLLAVLCSVGGITVGMLGLTQYGRWRRK